MNPSERRMIGVTSFGHAVCHFNMLVFPALVLPLSRYLGMSLADILNLSFWMYLLFGLTALFWGLLADKLGSRPLLLLFYCGSGVCSLMAYQWVDQPTGLSLALAGVGFFSGIYHPAALGMISTSITRVSLAMGINGMCGNVGLALAPLAAGLINWLWGPATVFLAVALANFAGFAVMLALPFQVDSRHGAVGAKDGPAMGFMMPFVIMLGAMMLGGVAYRGSTLMLPAFLETQATGWVDWVLGSVPLPANLTATLLASIIYLVGMAAQFLGGWAGERFDTRLAYFAFHALAAPAALFSCLAGSPWSGLLAMVYVFFLLGMQPAENTLVGCYTPARFRHSAFGLKFVITFGVGSLAVKLMGWVEKYWGMDWSFTVLGMVSLGIVAVISLLLWVTREKKASAREASATRAGEVG